MESNALSLMAVSQRWRVSPVFEFGDFVHDVLPCPGGSGGVARLPIDARQMAAERRGFFVFVLGRDEAIGFVLVAGLEGFLFAGGEVFAVIDAPRPEEYTVALFHVHFSCYEHEPTRSDLVSE